MRVEGWEQILWDEIEAARTGKFAWGTNDCATWAFGVRKAMTGKDAAAAWRGKYKTAIGAARCLRSLGAETHAGLATSILGEPLLTPALAQRGDIVLCENAFGVCVGSAFAFLSPEGLTFRPLKQIEMAWRV